ncbi:MAG: sigma 54-interacting transcriptional regulator [Firmicutes bacterium]|jgi:transcriptional regulator with PAS, ATPase and Fis domain|nr:sigma 54-interacting transcriptional regulator [Bacillota bacterium]
MIDIKSKSFIDFCHSAFDNIPVAIDFLDIEGNIIYINEAFSEFLQIPVDDMTGKLVTDINPTSKFLQTLKEKKADIAVVHEFPTGKKAICHRIPIINNTGGLVGGIGMILFDEVKNVKEVLEKYESLNKELNMYKKEIARMNHATYGLDDIIGKSMGIEECKKKVRKFSKVNFNVLITGESGVGKELFAHAIHRESERFDKAFVRVNCSAIPENLMESEFFGYEEGAFTGSKKGGSIGKFELADGGTIFLDEISEMPYYLQAKLLRVLQESELVRVGGKRVIPIDVKVICASNKNLKSMVDQGKFREDLYYRINVLNIDIPPLREREGDLEDLVRFFLHNFHRESGIFKKIDKDSLNILNEYKWPGNIRELKNLIDRICVMSDSVSLGIEDIPEYINTGSTERIDNSDTLKNAKEVVEENMIREALKKCDNNKSKASRYLDIPRNTLYRKIKEYNIEI